MSFIFNEAPVYDGSNAEHSKHLSSVILTELDAMGVVSKRNHVYKLVERVPMSVDASSFRCAENIRCGQLKSGGKPRESARCATDMGCHAGTRKCIANAFSLIDEEGTHGSCVRQ